MALFRRRKTFTPQSHRGSASHLFESLIQFLFNSGRNFQHRCPALVLNYVSSKYSNRRRRARRIRHDDLGKARGLRKFYCMKPAGASEREQRKIATVETALNRYSPQRPLHVCVCDRQHTLRRLDSSDLPAGNFAHFIRELGHGLLRARFIEIEIAAKQAATTKVAEHDMRISNGRQQRTPIASWARISPRRFGPNSQRAAVVNPGDRTAARADGVYIH